MMMMMDDPQDEDVATWYIFYSEKENREYYYHPESSTASWVLPAGARLHAHGDVEETETNEGATPREIGLGFFDDSDVVVDETTTRLPSKSFLRRFVTLVTGYRFGMALLLINVFLSSSWFGSVLLSTETSSGIIAQASTVHVVAEETIQVGVVVPGMYEYSPNTATPPVEQEPQPVIADSFMTRKTEQVKDAVEEATRKGNKILQKLEGAVESAGFPIDTHQSNQLIARAPDAKLLDQPCKRPLSRACRQKLRKMLSAQLDRSLELED
jgi:hypothetical protein